MSIAFALSKYALTGNRMHLKKMMSVATSKKGVCHGNEFVGVRA